MKKTCLLLLATALANAQTSINSLPAISAVAPTTVVPVVDVTGTPTTKKATASQLLGGLPDASGAARGVMTAAQAALLATAVSTNVASSLVQRDGSGNFAAGIITAASVTGLSSPVNGTDAANKSYVDAAAAGLVIKTPAVAATTANVTLSGGAPSTLDGITLVANNRVLVKNQSDNTQNGIYYVQTLGSGSNGTWARTTDADTGAKLVTGSYVFIAGGTVNANAAYTMTTTGTITIGTSAIVWNLFSQVTQIQAANVLGQIVQSQIADSAISTSKFASTIQPVGLVSSLPSPSGYSGPKTVFNQSDSKLYRYNGTAFVATIPASDLSTQITAGQVAANAITAGTIAVGAVSASELSSGAVTTAKLFTGAVDTNALAANAVVAAKIQAGTITADKLTISSLSSISANIGTVTSGTITANSSVDVGSGYGQIQISSSAGLSTAGGHIQIYGDGSNPWFRATGYESSSPSRIEINPNAAGGGIIPAALYAVTGGLAGVVVTGNGVFLQNSKPVSMGSGSYLQKTSSDGWSPVSFDGTHGLEMRWTGSALQVRIDSSTVLTIPTSP